MQVNVRAVLFLCTALLCRALGIAQTVHPALKDKVSPIQKVIKLIEDMKAQCEKEAEEDETNHEKYVCWCDSNKGEKTAAIEAAQKKIAELEAIIEEAVALEAQLKTEISELKKDIADGEESVAKMVGVRAKEAAAFKIEEADTMEVIGTLKQAVEVLSKVQLAQLHGDHRASAKVAPLFAQLQGVVRGLRRKSHFGEFRSVMQQDLWDVMSSIKEATGIGETATNQGRTLSVFERQGRLRAGQDPQSMGADAGAAAGAKSYNARSGQIFGMLEAMKEEFESDLMALQKQELTALMAFEKMKSEKEGEISAAKQQQELKEQTLADTQMKAATAKEDLAVTKDALGADQLFMVELEDKCASNEGEHAKRVKVRNDEIKALSEALNILTSDDARETFANTISFIQASTVQDSGSSATASAARNRMVNKAMKHILRFARKHQDWALATLAVRVRLDSFTKVKEMMDKMVAELKAQQKDDTVKKEFCEKQMDDTEDSIKVKENEKEDLEEKKLALENAGGELESEIEALEAEIAEMQVSVKKAGETRMQENTIFQKAVADQRATIQILKKVKARLMEFYSNKTSLVQVGKPGEANAPEPETSSYEKQGGGAGVIQMIAMITEDAKRTETELINSEQGAQTDYMQLVKDMNTGIETDRAAIAKKTTLLETSKADLADTEAALLTNGEELDTLSQALKGMHLDCDFLVKYYDVRQKARSEEIAGIVEAKAILSGADFGKAAEEADDASSLVQVHKRK